MRDQIRALVLAAGVGLTLAACGSSSSGGTHSATTGAAAAPTSTPATTTTASSSPPANAGTGGTTAAGTKLAPGTPALVNFEPESKVFRLQLNVLSIQKGSQTELDAVELSKTQREQTPYYVKLQVRNLGAGNASANDTNPADEFQATDDRGGQAQELSIIGTFRPCESVEVPKSFTHGVTYQTCVVYMVGKGGSLAQVQWTGNGGDAYGANPIVWQAG